MHFICAMNQKNTIIGMIPRRLLECIPLLSREEWADQVVAKFKENNPALYAEMGKWLDIPEEEQDALQNKVLAAIEQIRQPLLQ